MRITRRSDKFFNTKYLWMTFTCFVAGMIYISAFSSCTPSFDTQPSTDSSENPPNDDPPENRFNDRNRDNDCEDDETCLEVCKSIYVDYSEARECGNERRGKVGDLEQVFKRLVDGKENDLNEISGESDNVDLDVFEEYLQIGLSGWEKAIKDEIGSGKYDGRGYKNSTDLLNAIEWIAENERVSEILSDEDSGARILKALLERLDGEVDYISGGNSPEVCIENTKLSNLPTLSVDETTGIILLVAGTIDIHYYKRPTSPTISTGVSSRVSITAVGIQNDELYNDLSCFYQDLGGNGGNIFSLAVKEDNPELFKMAFSLLNSVCNDSDNGDYSPINRVRCRKAMLCWTVYDETDWLDETASSGSRENLFDEEFAEEFKNELEHNDSADFDECSAVEFGTLFK